MLHTVHATRYVTPLREGGSLPAIVEADDFGLYVVKFRRHLPVPLALSGEERFQMSGDNFIERALFGIAGPVSGVDSHAGGNECNLPRQPERRPHSNIRPAIFWKS